jgi:hypothetical protein
MLIKVHSGQLIVFRNMVSSSPKHAMTEQIKSDSVVRIRRGTRVLLAEGGQNPLCTPMWQMIRIKNRK